MMRSLRYEGTVVESFVHEPSNLEDDPEFQWSCCRAEVMWDCRLRPRIS